MWGNETDKFAAPIAPEYDAAKDMEGSIDDCYRAIRERQAAGGPGWNPNDE